MKYVLVFAAVCAAAWAQNPKPEVEWSGIEQQLNALRSAVQVHDIEAAHKASDALHLATSEQWQKQAPTPADYLRKAEAQAAAVPKSRADSLPYLAHLAAQAGEFDKADLYARESLATPSRSWDT